MGEFHCPVGAVGYDGDGCIYCKMCIARDKETMIAASEIIRKYIRSVSAARKKDIRVGKIAVCGKGGAGKSTFTALMAYAFEKYGYSPLVIDTDDSNDGLNTKLGFDTLPEPLIKYLPRFSLTGDTEPDISWLRKDPLRFEDIPQNHLLQRDNISFMSVGKIEDPFQGCSCSMGDLTRELVLNLSPQNKEIVLADQDAGVESFGRGVEQGVDTVIIIVEPSRESINLAEKIRYMSEGLGIRRIRAVLNKVLDKEQNRILRDMLIERDVRYLGTLYSSKDMSLSNLYGKPLVETELFAEAEKITGWMLDEAEMDRPFF